MRKTPVRLNEAQELKAVEMILEGYSKDQVKESLNVSGGVYYRLKARADEQALKARRKEGRQSKRDDSTSDEVVKLRAENAKLKKVVDMLLEGA